MLTYWLISFFLVGLLVPIGIMLFKTYPTIFEDMRQSSSGGITTNILYELPQVLKVKGGIVFFLFLMAQSATPLIAALITSSLIGRERIQDLISRWRFWSKEVGWKKGVSTWLLAIGSFSIVINLGTGIFAYLNKSPSVWPDFKFIANPLSPAFWFLFLTSLFFDGVGLLVETAWRGFLVPELQKKYQLLRASITVVILWSTWHMSVKLGEFLNGFAVFLLLCLFCMFLKSYEHDYFIVL